MRTDDLFGHSCWQKKIFLIIVAYLVEKAHIYTKPLTRNIADMPQASVVGYVLCNK